MLLLPMGRADDGAQYVFFRPCRCRSCGLVVIGVARRTKSWTCPTLLKGYVSVFVSRSALDDNFARPRCSGHTCMKLPSSLVQREERDRDERIRFRICICTGFVYAMCPKLRNGLTMSHPLW